MLNSVATFSLGALVALSCDSSALAQGCTNCALAAVDWTTLPSTYTHRDGVAVDQFDSGVEPTTYANELRETSIYRHHRSSLQGGNSADHYHRVDRFGSPVQPYGEWRYPYRPFSVPYQAWGPQLPQVYSNFGGIPRGFGLGVPGAVPPQQGMFPGFGPNFQGGFPGAGGGFIPSPANALPGQFDEYYPEAPEPPPMSDRDFFYSPIRP